MKALFFCTLVVMVTQTLGDEDCESVQDYNHQCGGWESLGYCSPDSPFHKQARELCPSSCGGCGFQYRAVDRCEGLQDTMPQCRAWKKRGYCSYLGKHHGYMMEHCAFSCNSCVPELYESGEQCAKLVDYDEDCARWSEEGLCELSSHANFMQRECGYSCAGCKAKVCAVARDTSSVCGDYKARGWCAPNHYYYRQVIKDCQATCNDCV